MVTTDRHGTSGGSEGYHRGAVRRARQHDELGVAIETRQLPQEIADVCADAEVVELAGVNADSHGLMILVGSGLQASGFGPAAGM